jgi:hypothetical protein
MGCAGSSPDRDQEEAKEKAIREAEETTEQVETILDAADADAVIVQQTQIAQPMAQPIMAQPMAQPIMAQPMGHPMLAQQQMLPLPPAPVEAMAPMQADISTVEVLPSNGNGPRCGVQFNMSGEFPLGIKLTLCWVKHNGGLHHWYDFRGYHAESASVYHAFVIFKSKQGAPQPNHGDDVPAGDVLIAVRPTTTGEHKVDLTLGAGDEVHVEVNGHPVAGTASLPSISHPLAQPVIMQPIIQPQIIQQHVMMPMQPMVMMAQPAVVAAPPALQVGSMAHQVEEIRSALGLPYAPLPEIVEQAIAALGLDLANETLMAKADACYDALFHTAPARQPSRSAVAASASTLFFFTSPTRAQQPGPVPFPSEISAVRITSKGGKPIPYKASKMREFEYPLAVARTRDERRGRDARSVIEPSLWAAATTSICSLTATRGRPTVGWSWCPTTTTWRSSPSRSRR